MKSFKTLLFGLMISVFMVSSVFATEYEDALAARQAALDAFDLVVQEDTANTQPNRQYCGTIKAIMAGFKATCDPGDHWDEGIYYEDLGDDAWNEGIIAENDAIGPVLGHVAFGNTDFSVGEWELNFNLDFAAAITAYQDAADHYADALEDLVLASSKYFTCASYWDSAAYEFEAGSPMEGM